MNTYLQVGRVLDGVRAGLHDWAAGVLREAGIHVAVSGAVPETGGVTLVLLPYELVPESQATVPTLGLVPASEQAQSTVPAPWRAVARGVTAVLLEEFPKRPARGPGLGPLDPVPPLSALPPPIARWYRAHAEDWVVQRAEPSGRLPSIAWRQPFSLSVRYAAMVVDPSGKSDLDGLRLTALGVLAAGVRLQRWFRVRVPGEPIDPILLDLLRAFSEVEAPAADGLADALEQALSPRDLAVGVTPHHEMTDADSALVKLALRQPMQASLVFTLRLSLGAGPELAPGAMPHVGPVGKVEEP